VRGSQSSAKYRGCQRGRTTQENQEPNPNSQKLTIKIKKDGNKKKKHAPYLTGNRKRP
jgi:hypothetical protein